MSYLSDLGTYLGIVQKKNEDTAVAQNEANFAQHGLIPTDGVNEIRPQDMFMEVDVADTLVDKKGYPVSFTDGIYDRLGDELVTNGDFSNGTTGWTVDNGTLAIIENGMLKVTDLTADTSFGVTKNISTEVGKTYITTYYKNPVTLTIYDGVSSNGNNILSNKKFGKAGTFYNVFVATSATTQIRIVLDSTGSGNYGYYDNISVKELPQFTLPKAPFATGSTDELLDDAVNGVTTQTNHSRGDLVVSGANLFDTATILSTGVTKAGDVVTFTNTADLAEAKPSSTITMYAGETITMVIDITSYTSGSYSMRFSSGTALTTSDIPVAYSAIGTYRRTITCTKTGTITLPIVRSDIGGSATISVYASRKDDIHIATEDTANMYDIEYTGQTTSLTGQNLLDNQTVIFVNDGNDINGLNLHFYKYVSTYTGGGIDLTTQDFSSTANWQDLGTASSMSLQNPYFKAIPYATKQVALLVEKTSAGAILNTVKPLVNMYGEESVLTYEADIMGELGYSQAKDRVWTDGSSEFILLGLKGYLNAGTYHPFFNTFGVKNYGKTDNYISQSSWYTAGTSTVPYSNLTYNHFKSVSLGGVVSDNSTNGVIGGFSGRPDSKFYDKTYIDGQGGLVCFSIPNAKTPTYKHQQEVKRNLVDGYIENGVELKNETYTETLGTGTATNVSVNDNSIYDLGDLVYVFNSSGTMIHYGKVTSKGSVVLGGWIILTDFNDNTSYSRVSGETNTIYRVQKSNYLATQGNQTHTDLIGDPANYPQDVKNITASGKGLGFINSLLIGQDGTDYIPSASIIKPIVSKKASYFPNEAISSVDNGITWAVSTIDNDVNLSYVDNTLKESAYGASNIFVVPYTAQNQSAVSIDTPQPIEYTDLDLIASNSHSVYAYNGLTYASSGKVATGTVVEAKGVDDVVQNKNFTFLSTDGVQTLEAGVIVKIVDNNVNDGLVENLYEWIGVGSVTADLEAFTYLTETNFKNVTISLTTPKHNTLTLDSDSIVGSKALVTQTVNAIQVFTQEMLWDDVNTTWHDSNKFDQLANGTITNLNGDTIQTKVLLKASSIALGEE